MAKILIVEDIPDNYELARKVLASRGHEVIHAPDAESGLKVAAAQIPDLILLDLGLPDHDGLTLAGWLREKSELDTTPILAFTAWPEDAARKMAESYGCNGFIGKPVANINKFAEQVESFLDSLKR